MKLVKIFILAFFFIIVLLGYSLFYQEKSSRVSKIYGQFCEPKYNVVFLKTHKCYSSSIQRIFLKFGILRNKVFVLPSSGNYLGHPELFNRRMVPKSSLFDKNYNILAHHTRFNEGEIKSVMPQDTIYVTVIRSPVDVYESIVGYWNFHKMLKLPSNFLEQGILPTKTLKNVRFVGKIGSNQMLFDLGYDANKMSNLEVKEAVRTLDKVFHLVMVAERLNESLIFLKDLLCWSLDDVVIFKINARKSRQKLNEMVKKRLKMLNWADSILYDHFHAKLEEKIRLFGVKRMASEVIKLKAREAQWHEYCVKRSFSKSLGLGTAAVINFENGHPENITCSLMTASEMQITEFLRNIQRINHPGSV